MSNLEKSKDGYKHTPIGWIPEDWEISVLERILNKTQYGLSIPNHPEGNVPIIGMSNIKDGILTIEKISKVRIDHETTKAYSIKKNDLLFNRTNSEELVGKTTIANENLNYVFASYLIRFQIKDGVIPKFIYYYFNNPNTVAKIRSFATPGVSQWNINPTALRKHLYIPLPPLPEQKKIAEILSTWDKAIEQTKNLIEAKKKLKKGLMQKLLTGRMRFPEFGKPAKIGKLPEGWHRLRIGDLLKKIERPVIFDDNHQYPLISVKRRSSGLTHRETLTGSEILVKDLYITEEDDFLISKMQVVHGALGIVTKNFTSMYISGSYITLVAKDKEHFNIKFFDFLSRSNYIYHAALISSYGVSIEKMTFNLRWFLHTPIIIPQSIKEQNRIVSTLSILESELNELEKKLSLLQTQKKGLLQKLLTGQIRVQVDSSKPKGKKK
ncbi:restriction endonuclease subunit S [Leptospira yasudae]|nr:restriction endonuclease subunit S [Leptospira yasudae]